MEQTQEQNSNKTMYKTSKYNYFVNYKDKVIWFNGISGSIVALNQKKAEILKILLNDLTSFKKTHPSLFEKFKDWHFITHQESNELDIIRYLNRKSVYNSQAQITINPTRNCNFDCWYCVQPHEKSLMSDEIQNRIKQHITDLVTKKEISSLVLSWFGGEPLLGFYEVVYPISMYCKELFEENNMQLDQQITTNASLIDEAMIGKMQEINLNKFQITLDGDEKRHNKIRNINGQPSFKTIMRNINLICKGINDPNISLRINYDEKTLDGNIKAIFDSIPQEYRKFIAINFQRVWQTTISKSKHNSIQENSKRIELQEYTNRLGFKHHLISNALTINKWAVCYVDKPNFKHIDYDGKIYKCTARDYTDKLQFGELSEDGTISWDMDKMSKMYGKSTFENEMCLKCKHLPLCKGPCSQKIYETPVEKLPNICSLKQSEVKVETFIIDLYKNQSKKKSAPEETVVQVV